MEFLDIEEVQSTNYYRMFLFKVDRCPMDKPHDWTLCPFAHVTEKAKRRNCTKYRYNGTACADFRKHGHCRRGDACPFAHGVFEAWLHPARYRTKMCLEGERCHRRVCFFAHTAEELRQPTEDELEVIKQLQAQLQAEVKQVPMFKAQLDRIAAALAAPAPPGRFQGLPFASLTPMDILRNEYQFAIVQQKLFIADTGRPSKGLEDYIKELENASIVLQQHSNQEVQKQYVSHMIASHEHLFTATQSSPTGDASNGQPAAVNLALAVDDISSRMSSLSTLHASTPVASPHAFTCGTYDQERTSSKNPSSRTSISSPDLLCHRTAVAGGCAAGENVALASNGSQQASDYTTAAFNLIEYNNIYFNNVDPAILPSPHGGKAQDVYKLALANESSGAPSQAAFNQATQSEAEQQAFLNMLAQAQYLNSNQQAYLDGSLAPAQYLQAGQHGFLDDNQAWSSDVGTGMNGSDGRVSMESATSVHTIQNRFVMAPPRLPSSTAQASNDYTSSLRLAQNDPSIEQMLAELPRSVAELA